LTEITIDMVRKRAEADAKTYGYHLVPDPELLQAFLEGLKVNEERYGSPSCPCRLASGKFEYDRDIICPCDYRDPDVAEFGACYCRLYVNNDVCESKKELPTVPERRPTAAHRGKAPAVEQTAGTELALPVWRCRVCGYLCARETPPEVCPICKAKKERFQRFM